MTKLLQKYSLYLIISIIIVGIIAISAVKIRLFIAENKTQTPQAILVLGGDRGREIAAAKIASQNPNLKVWVSSGLPPENVKKIFLKEKVSLNRINLDYSATDTVTNFTTLVANLKANNIQHIYIVTSEFHMPRSKVIAFWVLGSHGIAYSPISVASHQEKEPYYKIFRDVVRSWLWLFTGRTGSSFDPNPPLQPSL